MKRVEHGACDLGVVDPAQVRLLVDELSDAEAEAAFGRLIRERDRLQRWPAAGDTVATEDVWALANAREAIRGERW